MAAKKYTYTVIGNHGKWDKKTKGFIDYEGGSRVARVVSQHNEHLSQLIRLELAVLE